MLRLVNGQQDLALAHFEFRAGRWVFDSDEEGGYGVTVPALPGVVTQGDTLEEALEMARDAIALYIEDLIADGEPIPTEHVPPQLAKVTVAA